MNTLGAPDPLRWLETKPIAFRQSRLATSFKNMSDNELVFGRAMNQAIPFVLKSSIKNFTLLGRSFKPVDCVLHSLDSFRAQRAAL
jgi:hypothetical protein